MNFEIEKIANNDIEKFVELIEAFRVVFEMQNFEPPDFDYLQRNLRRENFVAFVALANDHVIGGLTAYLLDAYYLKGQYLFIYDLAVLPEYQRNGVGKRLIESLIKAYKNTDVTEVFVQAELADNYAVDFYRATGGIEQSVVNFSYPLKG